MERPRIRTTPHCATPEEIRTANEQLAREGKATRFSFDIHQECEKARRLVRATPAQLRAYLEHPDERIPLALLSNPLRPWGERYSWYVSASLTARCIRDFEVHGFAWTPLVDVAEKASWASWGKLKRWAKYEKREMPSPMIVPFRLTQVIEQYVQTHDDPEFVIELASFRSWRIHEILRDHVSHIPDAVLDRLFERIDANSSELLRSWISAQRLSASQLLRVEANALRRAISSAQARDDDGVFFSLHVLNLCDEAAGLSPETVEALFSFVREHPDSIARSAILEELAKFTESLDTSHLEMLRELAGNRPYILASIVRHPAVSLDTIRAISRQSNTPEVRMAIAQCLALYPDPELTRYLANNPSSTACASVLEHGVGGGFRQLLSALNSHTDIRMSAYVALQNLADRVLKTASSVSDRSSSYNDAPQDLKTAALQIAHVVQQTRAHQMLYTPVSWAGDLVANRLAEALILIRLYLGTIRDPADLSIALMSPDYTVRMLAITGLQHLQQLCRPSSSEAVATHTHAKDGSQRLCSSR